MNENNLDNLIGQRFGRLTITNYYVKEGERKITCDMKCDCGQEMFGYPLHRLVSGKVLSCGCARNDNQHGGRAREDIIGKRFNKLVILSEDTENNTALAKCDCGRETIIKKVRFKLKALREKGECEHCAAERRGNKKYKEIKEGAKYGLWTVIKRAENTEHGEPTYLCKCQCGTKKQVLGKYLYNGTSNSCGCAKSSNFDKKKKYDGLTKNKTGRILYNIWRYYLEKTKTEEKYNGIKFFPEWSESEDGTDGYKEFYQWATLKNEPFTPERRYLRRIDETKDFSQDNCYFSTEDPRKNSTLG